MNKRNDTLPAVIWADIYILNMNGEKTINNRDIYGPSLIMKGITISQLNSICLIELTFMIKYRTGYRRMKIIQ